MLEAIVFYILAAALVTFSVIMITRINPISAAINLVGAFAALAGLYALLDASFLAILQVLVYAGGIMVLVIFVIMLLNLHPNDLKPMKVEPLWTILVFAVLVVVLLGPILFCALPAEDFTWAVLPEGFGTLSMVGEKVFSTYLFPFEMLSLLLLTAVVGALVISKRKL